jgi:hypothetical protein
MDLILRDVLIMPVLALISLLESLKMNLQNSRVKNLRKAFSELADIGMGFWSG